MKLQTIKKEVTTYLKISKADNKDLIKTGILDSLSLMRLTIWIEKKFKIKISALDLSENKMKSANSIIDTIIKKIKN
jgi:acyl carrier protein